MATQPRASRGIRRLANTIAGLPIIRNATKPIYRRWFTHSAMGNNAYYGAFPSFASALTQIPEVMSSGFNTEAARHWYVERHDVVRVNDYPVIYWLGKLFVDGPRRLFDLGGHIGVSYYGFRRYLRYPEDLRWMIHDTPAAVAAGREWARGHDPGRLLSFADSPDAADGQEILLTCGALQYLDYTLPELLGRLASPPPHVLVNLVPMHQTSGFVTLQHIGVGICPYRVMAMPTFIAEMAALGYAVVDRWEALDKMLEVPFEPRCAIDRYHGFYFRRQVDR
jgi:putative methyltransferase (TIGR04325 family)